MASKYIECVWYRNALRAANKALLLSRKTAESMFVVHDREINMYGVGEGDSEPVWCRSSDNLNFICVINPMVH